MNLFRSEEHARRWSQFNPKSEAGSGFIRPARSRVVLRDGLDENYLSVWYPKRGAERMAVLQRIGKTTPWWLGTPDP